MKILFCGDVMGRSGREAIKAHVPMLRAQLGLDAVVVNGENAANGFGVTRKICDDFLAWGADAITAGDHCFDQQETHAFIGNYEKLLRPANFPSRLPGKGSYLLRLRDGRTLLVLHLHAQLFMKYQVDSPFECAEAILKDYLLGSSVTAILVDFHCEATSERMALGHFLDGRVSAVVGSHTHVPTSDYQILRNGTAYQTDAGMCGDYDSVIGFNKELAVTNFLRKVRGEKMTPALGEATLCGLYVETDDRTGLAVRVSPVRVGGQLSPTLPAPAL